jgi:serralysin
VLVKQTPNQTAVAGRSFFLLLPANTFVDPLGQFMTYSATGPSGAALPSWLTFSPVIRLLSGTVPVGTKSTTVVVTATNFWGAKTSESFAIVVK